MSEVALGVQNANTARADRSNRRGRPSGWYGVWLVVATEGSLFAYLLFSYYFALLQASEKWPPGGMPPLALASASTIIVIASSIALQWAQRAESQDGTKRLTFGLGLAVVLGAVFVAMQSYDWLRASALISANAYGSYYVVVTGLDIVHAFAGLIMLATLLYWSTAGRFKGARPAAVSIAAIYWNFTVIVWLFVFASFYLLPYVR
jgi:cytochrome c oxidase subunit 3